MKFPRPAQTLMGGKQRAGMSPSQGIGNKPLGWICGSRSGAGRAPQGYPQGYQGLGKCWNLSHGESSSMEKLDLRFPH